MTDEDAEIIYKEMLEMFGNDMPNSEQEPIRFAKYLTLYKFYKERNIRTEEE